MRRLSKITKFIIVFVLAVTMLFGSVISYAASVSERDWDELANSEGELRSSAVSSAQAAILADAKTGRILFGKSEYRDMQPASITKIMTAVLAVENTQMSDIVTISNDMAVEIMALEDDAKLCGFQKGETVYVEDLLYGLMLISGADAAIALAIHVGGTYDNFIDMMNEKAEELGMTRTTYKNPHGLYQSGHSTCAADYARLAIYANKFPSFVKVVSSAYYTPSDTDYHDYSGDGYRWRNSNKLVNGNSTYGYDYATGMKTGFTTPAQHTLVTSAEKGNQSLVGVVLKDTTNGKWINSITMFEYGFEYYDTVDIEQLFREKEIKAEVKNAASGIDGNEVYLEIAPDTKTYLTETKELCELIRANPDEYFTAVIEFDQDPLIAPIEKGDYIGTITYTYNNTHSYDDYLQESPDGSDLMTIELKAKLVAANDVNAVPMVTAEPTAVPEDFGKVDTNIIEEIQNNANNPLFKKIFIAVLIILAIVGGMMLYSYADRHLRYQQYSKRQKSVKPRHK